MTFEFRQHQQQRAYQDVGLTSLMDSRRHRPQPIYNQPVMTNGGQGYQSMQNQYNMNQQPMYSYQAPQPPQPQQQRPPPPQFIGNDPFMSSSNQLPLYPQPQVPQSIMMRPQNTSIMGNGNNLQVSNPMRHEPARQSPPQTSIMRPQQQNQQNKMEEENA